MIEPHVEQGGASSWFWIAANSDVRGFEPVVPALVEPEPGLGLAYEPDGFGAAAGAGGDAGLSSASRTFTPAWNWASWLRNFVATQSTMRAHDVPTVTRGAPGSLRWLGGSSGWG